MSACACGRWLPPWLWLSLGLLVVCACACRSMDTEGAGVPNWLLRGIAEVETESYWSDGVLRYAHKQDGAAGEVGPFQTTPEAFADVCRGNESFPRLRQDRKLAVSITLRYLCLLRARYRLPDTDHGWLLVARHYNAGRRPWLAIDYASEVWESGHARMTPTTPAE